MPKRGMTLGRMAGPGLALGSMSSSQLGAVASVPLMVAHGSLGISATRLVWAAVFSLILARPDFRRFSRRQWRAAATLGVVVAFMTLCYFMAVTLIPVGPAITIDFLGPLSVAVVALRGWPRLVLPVLAAFGVLAMSYSPHGWLFDPLGILFALGAGAGWAGYIVLMRHVGRLFSAQDGLCLSFIIASVVAMPVAIALDPPAHWLALVPEVAGIALLSPLIPFVFEMAALRRMDMGTFSILMSLEPAIGTLLGFILLGQVLAAQQVLGVLAVMSASIAAVLLSSVRRHELLADRKPCAAPGD